MRKRERERRRRSDERYKVTKDTKIQKKKNNRYICDCDFRRETRVRGVERSTLNGSTVLATFRDPFVDRRDETLADDPDPSISYDRSSSLSPLPRQPDRA